jgi:hypothetical protein
MEILPLSVRQVTIPLSIPIAQYLWDHCYEGRAVLPAAEALQILARSLPAEIPSCNPLLQVSGEFSRLLPLDPESDTLNIFHEISFFSDGRRHSRLMSLRLGRDRQLTRRVTHVSVLFLPVEPGMKDRKTGSAESCETKKNPCLREKGDREPGGGADPWPGEPSGPGGGVFSFPAEKLYGELVPFGPAYHNAVADIGLARTWGFACLSGGKHPEAASILGSPFPFDAAMHVACAWGQRYRNIVAFPVGFDRREILRPTASGGVYRCSVFPLADEGAVLRFHIRIDDHDGRPAERIYGLRMRDISGGRITPPVWVREGI